jgi:CHAT domain-containing protein
LFVVQREAKPTTLTPRVTVHELPVGAQALREQITAWRRVIERQARATARSSSEAVDHGRRLFDVLIGPAEDAIGAADRVLILPDGPLHNLPFAALARRTKKTNGRDRRPYQYLVEWKPIHTAISATVYAELKKTRRSSPWPATLVAFGDPRYPARTEDTKEIANLEVRRVMRSGYSFESLPATRTEVEAIGRRFGSEATLYLGAAATEERAKSIGATRYLHFATHGLLDARVPLNSALALTIPATLAGNTENGLLQAWEIFEQMRIDADLVTLSACETALGTELAGEGLIGLTRAFHYAGARSVLASLWSVADESTADLMASLYRHLHAGLSKDEALRRAQLESIATPARSAPFNWAAFTLTGDWR